MHSSKILQLVRSLNLKERKEFGRFLKMDFFNRKEEVIRFYNVLKRFIDEPESPNLKKINVFRKVFNKEKVSRHPRGEEKQVIHRRITYLSYELRKVIEQYLMLKELKENDLLKEKVLMEGFKRRQSDALFFQSCKRIEEKVEENNVLDYLKDLDLFLVYHNCITYAKTESDNSEGKMFKAACNYLDRFNRSCKFRYGLTAIVRGKIFTENYEVPFSKELELFSKDSLKATEPLISLYHSMYLVLKSDLANIDEYYNMKKLVLEHLDHLPQREKKELYLVTLNCAIIYFNRGKSEFAIETHKLHRLGLEKELMMEKDDKLDYFGFNNIVFTACFVNEFDWAERFIQKYHLLLDPEIQDTAVILSMANVYFRKGEFDASLDKLNEKTDFVNTYDKLVERGLRLRCYFEMKEFDVLESYLHTYRKFIDRNRDIADNVKKRDYNLIKYTRKIMFSIHDKEKLQKMKEELEPLAGVKYKAWLLDKIGDYL